jgi:NADH dehydrogenase/NADH:ubiquinone oxidoreductase subunit G
MTILEAAGAAGVFIPTLCCHEKLESYGACRICTVEAEINGRTGYVAACVRPVEKNMVVRTRSEKVNRIRKMLLEELLAHAPDSVDLSNLAREYGADKDRFEKEASFCILCGLCVRYCAEECRMRLGLRLGSRGRSVCPELVAKEC